jgi:hypothetical protein
MSPLDVAWVVLKQQSLPFDESEDHDAQHWTYPLGENPNNWDIDTMHTDPTGARYAHLRVPDPDHEGEYYDLDPDDIYADTKLNYHHQPKHLREPPLTNEDDDELFKPDTTKYAYDPDIGDTVELPEPEYWERHGDAWDWNVDEDIYPFYGEFMRDSLNLRPLPFSGDEFVEGEDIPLKHHLEDWEKQEQDAWNHYKAQFPQQQEEEYEV